MKNVILKAMFLGSFVFSVGTIAATQINGQQADSLTPHQIISVNGAANLSDAEKMLAKKTDALGVEFYKIIAVVGNNKLHVSAMTYTQ